MNKQFFIGIVMVGLGATCYGALATIVQFAYEDGYTVSEITAAQYIWGVFVLGALCFFHKRGAKQSLVLNKGKSLKLIAGGTTIGLTGIFYYLSIKYIPVSISVVLMMQTIWIGVLFESILEKTLPAIREIIAVLIILVGTLLATNAADNFHQLNIWGVFWGLAAAVSYTLFMVCANGLAPSINPTKRSFLMILGSTIAILIIGFPQLLSKFDYSIFWRWGLLLALLGPIIPAILFNKGFPKVGVGFGSILSSIEIPVSVGLAYVILGEKVIALQWMGIVLIILSVIIINGKVVMNSSVSEASLD